MAEEIIEETANQAPLKTIFKSAGLFFLGMMFGKAAFYIFRLIVARMGYEDYGTFSLALGLFDIANAVAVMGIAVGIQKLVAEKRAEGASKRINDLILSGLRLVLITGAVCAGLMVVFADQISIGLFRNPALAPVLQIIAVGLPFYVMTNVLLGALRAYEKVKYEIFTRQFVETGVKLGLAMLFMYFGWRLSGIAFAYLIGTLVSFCLALYFMEFRTHRFLRTDEKRVGAEGAILAFSIPLMLTQIVYIFLTWSDVVFLGLFRSIGEVGIYNAALPTAALLITFPLALNIVFLPITSGLLASKRNDEFRKIYAVLGKWSLGFNFALFLLFLAFGRQVTRVLFGPAYELAEVPLQILAFGYLVYSLSFNSADVLSALGRPKKVLVNVTAAAVANLALIIVLVPSLGTLGAALSTSLSLMLFGGLNTYEVYKATGALPFSRHSHKIVLGGAASMLIAILCFRSLAVGSSTYTLVLFGLLYGAMYVCAAFLLRIPDRTDFEMLLALEKKAGISLAFIKKPLKRYYRME